MANRFQYRITADDQTEKGVASAQKRLGQLGKSSVVAAKQGGSAQRKAEADYKKALDARKRATSGLVSSVGSGASVVGEAVGLSRYTSTLGQFHGALSSATQGMREAREAGGGLGGAISGIAATAGGAIGIVAALAAGAVKLASGWAEGGAQLGRLSQSLGVTTGDLQKFQAVGEQFGVSKEETTGALGSLGSTLFDAQHGRNQQALGGLGQLGLGMKLKPDGSVDTSAMMLDLSDKIAKQTDPQLQAQIASLYGVSSMLPMLRQGSGAIRSRMADAGKYAAVMPDEDIGSSSRIWEKGILVKQLAGRGGMLADRGIALSSEGALDAGLASGRRAADGGGVGSAVTGVASAGVHALGGAAKWAADAVGGLAGRIEHLGERSRQDQVSPKGATGVMQVMPGTARDVARRLGEGFDPKRYQTDAAYSRHLGSEYVGEMLSHYDGDETLATAAYNAGPGRVDKGRRRYMEDHGGKFDEHDFVTSPNYLPKETRDYVARVTGTQKIDLHIHGLPLGTRVSAKSDKGAIAIGQAMSGSGP